MSRHRLRPILTLLALLLLPADVSAAADAVVEKEATYPISGSSGIELYTSIGERGPKAGGHIAQTGFTLRWKRLFDERDGSCHLVSARPSLVITYTYPKPENRLSAGMKRRWDRFSAGLRRHEQEHGRMLREMVAGTQASIDGLSMPADKSCAKIKREVTRRIDEAKLAYQERSRAFDRQELSEGGPVHRLILALVNEE